MKCGGRNAIFIVDINNTRAKQNSTRRYKSFCIRLRGLVVTSNGFPYHKQY